MSVDEPQYVTHEVLAEAMRAAYTGEGPPVRITAASGGAGGILPGTAGFIEFGRSAAKQTDRDLLARIIQEQTCDIATETPDWESGQPAFSWCEIHYPDCEPRGGDGNSEQEFSWLEMRGGVCPVALQAAEAILASQPDGPAQAQAREPMRSTLSGFDVGPATGAVP